MLGRKFHTESFPGFMGNSKKVMTEIWSNDSALASEG